MDLASHLGLIEDQGYTVIERVLSEKQVAAVKTGLAPWLQKKLMGRNNFEGHFSERVYALLDKSESLAPLIEHPYVLGIVDALLAPNYLLSSNLAINVHPGETPQPFHADHTQVPNCNRADINGVSTIWALDDFTTTNGATEVIAGSHKWQQLKTIADRDAVQVIMPAGSVLVFHGSLIHRGGANRSDTSRLAITPQYCQSWLRQLENMVLAVRPEQAARYSTRIQELLGYSIREPGFMGYVDGLHPRRLIADNYQGRHARGLTS